MGGYGGNRRNSPDIVPLITSSNANTTKNITEENNNGYLSEEELHPYRISIPNVYNEEWEMCGYSAKDDYVNYCLTTLCIKKPEDFMTSILGGLLERSFAL